MLFVNKKEEKVKVRFGEVGKFYWISLKPGEEVDIPRSYGENLGLKEVKKGLPPVEKSKSKKLANKILDKIKPGKKGKKKVEKKEPEKKEAEHSLTEKGKKALKEIEKEDDYEKELKNIKGIGSETTKDILKVYPTKTAMITALNNNLELPFRNDVVEKIKKHFIK